jgi:hypothetical protein
MKHVETIGRINLQIVETLLTRRTKFDRWECEYAEPIASAIQGIANEEEIVVAEMHLAACAECRRAVLMLREIDLYLKNP